MELTHALLQLVEDGQVLASEVLFYLAVKGPLLGLN